MHSNYAPSFILKGLQEEAWSMHVFQILLLDFNTCTVTRLESIMLQNLPITLFWIFPNFLPIMLVFMLSRYGLC